MRLRPLLVGLCLLAFVAPAAARASMTMTIGAAEDEGRNADPAVARAKVDLATAAGFKALRVTAIWSPGQSSVPDDQLAALQAIAAAGVFDGVTIYTTIMPYGSRTTPLSEAARRDFASFAADLARRVPQMRNLIIGNEPNINRYWLPQFGPNGEDVAARSYEKLLARTYDAVKAVDPATFVIGGSVSPHGSDNPKLSRHTHSPTAFIVDLGTAYRDSGRTKPIMDGFALHPYGENSSVAPDIGHPNSSSIGLADYDKLVRLLGRAFDGTAQVGSQLPIVYDEYGIESVIPSAKRGAYIGREPASTKPVSEATQGRYYDKALEMAACQPTVRAMFLFHVTDESNLDRWQSGVYYADGTPKSTRAVVQQTIDQIAAGAVDCAVAGHEDDGWSVVSSTPPPPAQPKKTRRLDATNLWNLLSTG
jgi:hypothetical protein